MNANSDLDALAAIQTEEIPDEVLCATNLDTIVNRIDVKVLPRRTALAFIRMVTPETSSSQGPAKVHEIYCLGIISDIISSVSGYKYAVIHEDTEGGTAMSSFRDGESRVFGLNDSGIWQNRGKLKAAFGEAAYDSLRPFYGWIEKLSPDTIETDMPVPLTATSTSLKDVKEASRKREASRGLRTSFFNNLEALNSMVRNVYDLTEDARLFTTIKKKLQHSVEHLEGFKSKESTLNMLSFSFMPINPKSKYAAKDLQNNFTFTELLFPEQLVKQMEDY